MLFFHKIAYNLSIALLQFGFWIGRFFSEKINQGYQGRKNWTQNSGFDSPPEKKVFWMHVASLGEFEQGRPVLDAFRTKHPDWHIVLTFFSASGFEMRKNYPKADSILYLPLDTPTNARTFLEKIRPDAVVFVKYEFWYNVLNQLKKQFPNIPTLLIAAKFRPDQVFFKPYGGLFRAMLESFTAIATQDAASVDLLAGIGYTNAVQMGDPRVDRVLDLPSEAFQNSKIEAFALGYWVVIAGSTWPKDVEIIANSQSNWPQNAQTPTKIIFAPHQPDQAAVSQILALFPHAVRYTTASIADCAGAQILILDTIGILNKTYRFGKVAYIGGGFGTGIHNTLEPAAYGLPVIFGPKYHKFEEAVRFIEQGAAFSVQNPSDVNNVMAFLAERKNYLDAQKAILSYLEENKGASTGIMNLLSNG